MKPDPEKHQFHMLVQVKPAVVVKAMITINNQNHLQPTMGMGLSAAIRLQINLDLRKVLMMMMVTITTMMAMGMVEMNMRSKLSILDTLAGLSESNGAGSAGRLVELELESTPLAP